MDSTGGSNAHRLLTSTQWLSSQTPPPPVSLHLAFILPSWLLLVWISDIPGGLPKGPGPWCSRHRKLNAPNVCSAPTRSWGLLGPRDPEMTSPDSGLLQIVGQETTHQEPGSTLLPSHSRLTCSTDLYQEPPVGSSRSRCWGHRRAVTEDAAPRA